MQNDPRNRVNAPAIGLMVTGGLGIAGALLSILISAIGGVAALAGKDAASALPNVGVTLVTSVIGLAVSGFIIYSAMQMRQLNGWGMSMAGAIVAMIPCISPCCLLGIPIGIWAILVLIDDEVKRAFAGGGFMPPPGGYTPPPGPYNPPPGGYGPPTGGYGPPTGGYGPPQGTPPPASGPYGDPPSGSSDPGPFGLPR